MSLGGRVAKAGAGAPENKGEKEAPQVRGLKKPKGRREKEVQSEGGRTSG